MELTPLRIGIDIDGVLADFNEAFIPRVIAITGKDLFGPGFVPTTWNYPQAVGYTNKEIHTVWEDITADPWFWFNLKPYPHTAATLMYLAGLQRQGHYVYYITARPGVNAKNQTERWLERQMRGQILAEPTPTVLISSEKGLCVEALRLDFYIDDRNENVDDVLHRTFRTQVWIFDQPWNKTYNDEYRMTSVVQAIQNLIDLKIVAVAR